MEYGWTRRCRRASPRHLFQHQCLPLTNAAGETRHVRWSLVRNAVRGARQEQARQPQRRLRSRTSLRRSAGTLAGTWSDGCRAEDPVNDATKPLPADRQQIDVGTSRSIAPPSGRTAPARNITFDPLTLPAGMASADLLPRARRLSVSLRGTAGREPSAASGNPQIRRA